MNGAFINDKGEIPQKIVGNIFTVLYEYETVRSLMIQWFIEDNIGCQRSTVQGTLAEQL